MLEDFAYANQLGSAVCGVHPKQDDPECGQTQPDDQFTEVLVLGQQNPFVGCGMTQDGLVVCTAGGLHRVPNVVTVVTQASDQDRIAAFVGSELHSGLPDAGTISSAAKWSAANAAAAWISSSVKWG